MPNNDAKRLIRKVALAHFKDKKMLLVRDSKNDTVFIMPGGKVEEGETDIECLNREVKEELGIKLEPSSIKFLQEFNGPAHGHGDDVLLNIKIYQAEMIGKPVPDMDEIVEIRYFDTHDDHKHFSEIGETQIMPWLKRHGYIN